MHVRQATFYLYHAGFSYEYVCKLLKFGIDTGNVTAAGVPELHRPRAYNIMKKDGRVEFFVVLSKLTFYITSGESQVTHLAKDARNPLFPVDGPLNDDADENRIYAWVVLGLTSMTPKDIDMYCREILMEEDNNS